MATLTQPKVEQKTLVRYRVETGLGILELDDPPANTYTYEMMRQLDEAILQARFDDNVHVIVLRGHGDKFFSAGANIAYLNSITPRYKYFFCLHANETLNRLEHTPKLEAVEGLIRMQAEEVLIAGGDAVQVRDVRPCREELVAVPAQHDDVDVVVEARLQDRLVQLAHHLVGVGVRGRIVQLEDPEPGFDAIADQRLLLDLGLRQRRHIPSASVYRGTRLGEAAEEDARDQGREPVGVDLARGVVPVVDPVHHAKERVRGRAALHRALVGRRVLEQPLEQVHVTSLDDIDPAQPLARE